MYDNLPGTSYYWDLFHRPESYHHRLDPGYLTNMHAFSSHYPYALSEHNFRETAFRPCGKTDATLEHEMWIKDVRHKYGAGSLSQRPFADKLRTRIGDSFAEVESATKDRFFEAQRQQDLRARFPESNLVGGRGHLFITPSRLYDNPDYRDLPRRSKPDFQPDIDSALRNIMVPVSADIKPVDELLFILTECSRLESDWREARRLAHGPITGRLKKSLDFVPKDPYDFAEDILLDLFEELGYKPSEKEIQLFIRRFGAGGRVPKETLVALLEGDRPNIKTQEQAYSLSPEAEQHYAALRGSSHPQDAKWLPLLFKSLLKQEALKEKYTSRGVSTTEAFKELGKERIDPETLRDLLIVRGVFIPVEDLTHLCSTISGGAFNTKTDWGITELHQYLGRKET